MQLFQQWFLTVADNIWNNLEINRIVPICFVYRLFTQRMASVYSYSSIYNVGTLWHIDMNLLVYVNLVKENVMESNTWRSPATTTLIGMQCQKIAKIFTGLTYKLLLSFTFITDVYRSFSRNTFTTKYCLSYSMDFKAPQEHCCTIEVWE